CGRGAQLADVNGFREIHLEQRALALRERAEVMRMELVIRAGRELALRFAHALHRGLVARLRAGFGDLAGRFVAEPAGRERLHDLNTAAVAMHVAEAAEVHGNIKAKFLAGSEGARQLVMFAAMAQADVNDLATPRVRERLHLRL